MSKHDLRVTKTKQSIHQSLLELLKKKPLINIKVTELCKEANINRGTFYFHYREVSDVFQEFFEELMQDLKESYMEPYKHDQHIESKSLDPNTIGIFHHVKRYEDYYRIILSKDVSIKYYYMLFDEIRENCMLDNNIKRNKHISSFFYSYMANAIIGLIIEWVRRDFNYSAEDMNIQLVKIINI